MMRQLISAWPQNTKTASWCKPSSMQHPSTAAHQSAAHAGRARPRPCWHSLRRQQMQAACPPVLAGLLGPRQSASHAAGGGQSAAAAARQPA